MLYNPICFSSKKKSQCGMGFGRSFFHGNVFDDISYRLFLFKYVHYKEYQCHLCNLTLYYLTKRKTILLWEERLYTLYIHEFHCINWWQYQKISLIKVFEC